MTRLITLCSIIMAIILIVTILQEYYFITVENIDILRESIRDMYEIFEL